MKLTNTQKKIISQASYESYIAIRLIARKIGLSTTCVRVNIKELEAMGMIDIAPKAYKTESSLVRLANNKAVKKINDKPSFDQLMKIVLAA